MKVRQFLPEDHDILATWWKDWGFPVITLNLLPRFGLIINDGESDVCAGFCYCTDSDYALIEYFVCNRKYRDKEKKKEAFEVLFDCLNNYARVMGYKILSTNIHAKEASFHKRLLDYGFTKGDTNMVNFLKGVK